MEPFRWNVWYIRLFRIWISKTWSRNRGRYRPPRKYTQLPFSPGLPYISLSLSLSFTLTQRKAIIDSIKRLYKSYGVIYKGLKCFKQHPRKRIAVADIPGIRMYTPQPSTLFFSPLQTNPFSAWMLKPIPGAPGDTSWGTINRKRYFFFFFFLYWPLGFSLDVQVP